MSRPSQVHIIDATLREGRQAPGVLFDDAAVSEIAALLEQAGVDTIECGHPAISSEERARIKAVRQVLRKTPLLCHSRALMRDIEYASDVGADWVGIFLGVNSVSRATKLSGRSRDEAFSMIETATKRAVRLGLHVRYTLEDASRTDESDLIKAYEIAIEAGASRICFSDTVGILSPRQAGRWVSLIRRRFASVPLEVHFHDDRGLALANALDAIGAGADWISTSVNGLGERCGIVDLAALSANLDVDGVRKLAAPDVLQQLSALVARASGKAIDARRPVVGADAFTHNSRLHRLAVQRDSESYEWIRPERVGRHSVVPDVEHPGARVLADVKADGR